MPGGKWGVPDLQVMRRRHPPVNLRNAYLDGLAEPQELFLERLVSAGDVLCLGERAYAVVNGGSLVEFHAEETSHKLHRSLLDEAMRLSGASEILCKSFDKQLLEAVPGQASGAETVGHLFRRTVDVRVAARAEVTPRPASAGDVAEVARLNDGFFDSIEEIEDYAAIDGLQLFTSGGAVIGCGIARPVIAGRGDIDVGMWVVPEHRRRGYGSQIVAEMKRRVLARGGRPICGCDVANAASYHALVAAGFVSEHRLLRIPYAVA